MFVKVSCGLLALLSIISLGDAKNIRVRLGDASTYARKIYSEIKEADPALWKRTDDIIVNAPDNEIIHAVHVTDLREDKDGEAFIESGGLGKKSVTIGLKSPTILRGYRFEIEVYSINPTHQHYIKEAYKPHMYPGYARKP